MKSEREKTFDILKSVKNDDGSSYFSIDWIKENILGTDKFEERKKKIKRILKDE